MNVLWKFKDESRRRRGGHEIRSDGEEVAVVSEKVPLEWRLIESCFLLELADSVSCQYLIELGYGSDYY